MSWLIGHATLHYLDFAPDGVKWLVPEEQALTEIGQAGYYGVPAGPRKDKSTKELADRFATFGLKLGPGYLGVEYWKPEERESILERARGLARYSAEAGLSEVFVAASGFDKYVTRSGKTRNQIAGRVSPEDALSDDEFARTVDVLSQVCEITLKEGVKSCFHNHVGSVIETEQETERLLSAISPDLLFLGPDIGHLVWAGVDPIAFCKKHASRIKSVHIKDIYEPVLRRGLEQGWAYKEYSDNGIFAEIGEGMIDFPAFFSVLRDSGYDGWIIVETDVTTKPTGKESVEASRNYLRSIGV